MFNRISTLILLTFLLSIVSCSKSPQEAIIGKWEFSQNNTKASFSFYPNNKGTQTFKDTTLDFEYSFITDDTLHIQLQGLVPASYTLKIVSINHSTLTIREPNKEAVAFSRSKEF